MALLVLLLYHHHPRPEKLNLMVDHLPQHMQRMATSLTAHVVGVLLLLLGGQLQRLMT